MYSTYLSYLPQSSFSYDLKELSDNRGKFTEILKSNIFGQVSYFTINKGQERGGHFHHTKTEKFIVLSGKAKIQFKNILTKKKIDLIVCIEKTQVIEIVPGWVHSIKNIGIKEVIVLVWSNEIFDKSRPDTISERVDD